MCARTAPPDDGEAGVAARLARARATLLAARAREPELVAGLAEPDDAPLTPPQAGMWFEQRLAGSSVDYHVSQAWRVDGPLVVDAVERALWALCDRHDALRSAFPVVQGIPRQRPALAPPAISIEDLSAAPDRDLALREALRAARLEPFDLAGGPMFRARLLRTGPDAHVVALTVNHLVYDGWSAAVLVRELSAYYEAAVRGVAPDLPPLPLRYADYAVWLVRRAEAGAFDTVVARRAERLAGVPAGLPQLSPDGSGKAAGPDAVGAHLATSTLERGVTGRARELARALDATLFPVMLAAFQAVVARLSGAERFTVGTPAHGRVRRSLHGLVGMFVHTVPVPLRCDDDPSFEQLVVRAREETYQAQDDAEVPLDRLVVAMQPARGGGRSPLFQAWFDCRPASATPALSGVRCIELPVGAPRARFGVELHVKDRGDDCGVTGLARPQFADAAATRLLVDRFASMVAAAVEAPELPVRRLLDRLEEGA